MGCAFGRRFGDDRECCGRMARCSDVILARDVLKDDVQRWKVGMDSLNLCRRWILRLRLYIHYFLDCFYASYFCLEDWDDAYDHMDTSLLAVGPVQHLRTDAIIAAVVCSKKRL